MITVEKRAVYFGTRQLSAANPTEQGAFAGVPSPDWRDAGAVNVCPPSTIGLLTPQNTVHNTAVSLLAPDKANTLGPITAIAIAGDSPIASVRLSVDGKIFAISPDRPYVGTLSPTAKVEVMPGRTAPMVYRLPDNVVPTFAQFQQWVVAWDCNTDEKVPAASFGFPSDVAAPRPLVRLDVYRGGVPSHLGGSSKRAVYQAEIEWFAQAETIGVEPDTEEVWNNPTLFAIVDGRRRFRLTAVCLKADPGDAAPQLQIWGVEGFKSTNGLNTTSGSSARVDFPSFDELMAPTDIPDTEVTGHAALVYDYIGNPYWGVMARILTPDNTDGLNEGPEPSQGYLTLSAWDD